MSGIRVLVGTQKCAFILTSDGNRQRWKLSGPHFVGWEIFHLTGSIADPNRLNASQYNSWFGHLIQRFNDGGETWEPAGNKFLLDGAIGNYEGYDGTPQAWEFKRVWHLEPSLSVPDCIYAGAEDASLFRSADGGQNWQEFRGFRAQGSARRWQPGRTGMCSHTILLDPGNPRRLFAAVMAAGGFLTDDAGETWRPINRGLKSQYIADPNAEVGHCVHSIARHADGYRASVEQRPVLSTAGLASFTDNRQDASLQAGHGGRSPSVSCDFEKENANDN